VNPWRVARTPGHAGERVVPAGLGPLVGWIERYQAFWLDRLGRMKKLLEEMER
jgi:hypothetical protein